MATGKRYFWIKLKSTFMTSDAVDFLMGQPDGANYVVLYQMLCLKTINTGGKLERHIGEIIIPYDEAKIQRDCKWFSIDTVRVALNLYKSLGLIYADQDGVLCLTGHDDLVGSETDYAVQKKRQRAGEPAQSLPPPVDRRMDTTVDNAVENVHTEIEYRDRVRDRGNIETSDEVSCRPEDRQSVISAWNALGLAQITKIVPGTNRYKQLNARIREYGLDKVLEAIENVRKSPFLRGQNRTGWIAAFDWLIKPNNFCKVLDGNYADHAAGAAPAGRAPAQGTSTADRLLRMAQEGAFDNDPK